MLSANVIRSRLVTSMPKSSRSLACSAVRNAQRSTKGTSPADSSRKVLLSRAAAGFAAGLSIALYSGWTAQQNGSQAVQCESVDDLIVNRKSDDGETMRRKSKIVNNIGDEHDPTRPKEWDDPEVCSRGPLKACFSR
jgi:pectin methylesterase-like acyl-CoA thioesterase